MRTVADEIVKLLREAGVQVVFGIPSIHNIPLYESLRKDGSIRHILCRQEATAAHMADGYARLRGGLGVVIASTGPGTGYLHPAIQEAWGSCSPVLIITTNIPLSKIGKGLGTLHEMDEQETLFRTVTKATFALRSPGEVSRIKDEILAVALSDRPGPVYLEVPTDLLQGASVKDMKIPAGRKENGTPIPDLQKALSLLSDCEKPLIIAGTEAIRAGMAGDIYTLAEILGAPVITTVPAKGIIPEDHPLSFGNAAKRGVVREMVQACDVTVAVGTRLREVDAKRRGLKLPKLIHMTWDDRWLNRNFQADVPLTGDIPDILEELTAGLKPPPSLDQRRKWINEMREKLDTETQLIRRSHPEMEYLEVIREIMPRDGILVMDNTQLAYWAEYFFPSYCPGGLVPAKGSLPIGFGFPAAIGARIARPEKKIIGLTGDGGFLYGAHELATCIRHNIGFPLIVVNDNAYGIIGYLQKNSYGNEYETRLANPDFVALAESFGTRGVRVDSPASLGDALLKALESEDMWVIELSANFPEPPFARY